MDLTNLEAKERRLPALPRLVLNGMVILPQMDLDWEVIRGMWVLPGCRVVTTHQVEVIAERNGWHLTLLNKENVLLA